MEFLLEHWRIKRPIGPCHYGIGTLFMQVEYPFRNYNLFQYLYVLSFYERAGKTSGFWKRWRRWKPSWTTAGSWWNAWCPSWPA